MSQDSPDQPKIFSRAWYNEYFRRADSSQTHARFCERVYGQDLCQHGLMHMEELDLLVSLIEPGAKILEVGCSNGYVAEYVHERVDATILGIDFSDVAIEQASRRTRGVETLRFLQVDLTRDEIPGQGYDYILLIDSLYFLGSYEETLRRLAEKLNDPGKIVLSIFQVKEEGEPEGHLLPDGTWPAQALQSLGWPYTWYDFTAAVREHGLRNYQVGEELKAAFEAEGNEFLYQARAAENRFFRECAVKEEIVRYVYVADV